VDRDRGRALILAFAFVVSTLSAQAASSDLSGTWILDTARSTASGGGTGGRESGTGRGGGLGLGASPDQLTIRQSGSLMTVEARRGTTTTLLSFAIDGTRTGNTVSSGRNSGESAMHVSVWKNGRLETAITAPRAPGTEETVTFNEVRYLNADGSLVVETTMAGRPNKRTAVYRRSPR
jgi:hypothetical protein